MKLASKNVRRNIRASVPTRAEIASSILVSASLFVGPSVLVSTTTTAKPPRRGADGVGVIGIGRAYLGNREGAIPDAPRPAGSTYIAGAGDEGTARSQRRGEGGDIARAAGELSKIAPDARTILSKDDGRLRRSSGVGWAAAHAPNNSRYSVFSTI